MFCIYHKTVFDITVYGVHMCVCPIDYLAQNNKRGNVSHGKYVT